MYKVKKSDLKGQIKDFPIEVVQKMVEKQVHQGHKADVKVFQVNAISGWDGFVWARTIEGNSFWRNVIYQADFPLFFEKYPKKKEKEEPKGNTDKPPLGVMPKFIWDRKRIASLKEGIRRYLDADKPIPVDWTAEYNELVKGKYLFKTK